MFAACGRKWRILSLALHPLFLEAVREVRLTSDHIGSKISPLTCSQASSSVAPTASFFTQPSLLATPEAEFPVVRVIYDFTPTSPFELAVHGQSACIGSRCCPSALTPSVLEGASVRVIEDDDGSGWVKVVDEDGGRGLVPASYIESEDVAQVAGPAIGPLRSSGQFGEWQHHLDWFPSFLISSYCRKFVECMSTTPKVQTSWTFRRAIVSS